MKDIHNKPLKRLKPAYIIYSALALIIIISVITIYINKEQPLFANVYQDGELIAAYRLDDDISVKINSPNGGYNILEISAGQAYISAADCPDGLCLLMRGHSTIACLPNKLLINISGAYDDIDGVTR